jgi:chromosome partitioning protein
VRSVALANQKGGVGKTTTAVHLAHGLALAGLRVALFDLDPQGNATVALQSMGGSTAAVESVPEFSTGPLDVLRHVRPGLWLLAAPEDEPGAGEPDLPSLMRLVDDLRAEGVDWLLIDCPPRMDAWGWAGLHLCAEVLVPVQAEFFAMHGLSQMLATLERFAAAHPKRRHRLAGILPTMVDTRAAVCREVTADLRRTLGDRVLDTVILRDPQFVEAASHGLTVYQYNPRAKGALCYGELVREVIDGGSPLG